MKIKGRIKRLEDMLGREDDRPKIPDHTPEERAILKEVAILLMQRVVDRPGSRNLDEEKKLIREVMAEVLAKKGKETSDHFLEVLGWGGKGPGARGEE